MDIRHVVSSCAHLNQTWHITDENTRKEVQELKARQAALAPQPTPTSSPSPEPILRDIHHDVKTFIIAMGPVSHAQKGD